MRILFSAIPGYGHVVPMVPLMAAARRAGHEVAIMTNEVMGAVVPVRLLPVGPTLEQLMSEHARRSDVWDAADPDPREGASFFAGTRVDMTADAALEAASAFRPDVVVGDVMDCVTPLVAAAQGVPWAYHAFGPRAVEASGVAPSEAISAIMDATTGERMEAAGLTATSRVAYLDPCPPSLQLPGWQPPSDRIGVRPQPYAGDGAPWAPPDGVGSGARPVVVVTVGTVVTDPSLVRELVVSLSGIDADLLLTADPDAVPGPSGPGRVHAVGFAPLHRLLEGADLVVSTAGAGTVLAAMARGLPMVLLPQLAEQPWNAARVAAAGAGVVVDAPQGAGAAAGAVLADAGFRHAARRVAAEIASMDDPDRALSELVGRVVDATAPRP